MDGYPAGSGFHSHNPRSPLFDSDQPWDGEGDSPFEGDFLIQSARLESQGELMQLLWDRVSSAATAPECAIDKAVADAIDAALKPLLPLLRQHPCRDVRRYAQERMSHG